VVLALFQPVDRPKEDVRRSIAHLQAVAAKDFKQFMDWIIENRDSQRRLNDHTTDTALLHQGQGKSQAFTELEEEIEKNDEMLNQMNQKNRR